MLVRGLLWMSRRRESRLDNLVKAWDDTKVYILDPL